MDAGLRVGGFWDLRLMGLKKPKPSTLNSKAPKLLDPSTYESTGLVCVEGVQGFGREVYRFDGLKPKPETV